jgi:ADP-ribosylation factor related protein 1
LNFWDLGGQTDLHSIWSSYYADSHAIVFMVDSTDTARINEVMPVLSKIIQNDETEGVPVLMLANKQAVSGALSVDGI